MASRLLSLSCVQGFYSILRRFAKRREKTFDPKSGMQARQVVTERGGLGFISMYVLIRTTATSPSGAESVPAEEPIFKRNFKERRMYDMDGLPYTDAIFSRQREQITARISGSRRLGMSELVATEQ
jgi:hypothetical protein